MKHPVWILLAGSALLTGGRCADTPRSGGELRLAIQAEPRTLDPLLAADEPSELVRYLTTGALIRLNRETQTLEPELATSWKVSEGGRKISVQLRQGVTFSDGTPFEPKDVCYTFERLLDPKLDSPVAEAFRVGNGKVVCQLEADRGVSLRFPEPLAGVERLLDGVPILSGRPAQKEKAGLGPFILGEQKPGSYLVLARNSRYWKRDARGVQLPYLDSIRLEVQRNRDFELLRFRRGELQIVNNLDPESFEKLKAEMPLAVRDLGVSMDSEQIWFNQASSAPIPAHKKQWFRSTEFRLAISEAIRRADLARVVYRGHATPASGPVSPANRFWFNSGLRPPAGDAASARARLVREGFQLRGKVLYDRAGNPVEFSIITNAGNKSRERMAAMIQQDLVVLGIRVTVVPLDFPSLIDRITKSFEYEACLLGLVNADLDPNSQMNVWLSSSGLHQWNPNQKKPETEWEAEIDRLMLRQASELDTKRRKEAFDRVQQIVAEQAPFIYLVHRNALVAISAEVRNIQPSVLRPQTLWSAERVFLADGATRALR